MRATASRRSLGAGDVHVWRLGDRAAVVSLLAYYLGTDAATVRLRRDALGKLELGGVRAAALRFSITHAGGVVLLAVARRRVGVDVEVLHSRPTVRALVDEALTPREQHSLPVDGASRASAFLCRWVRKEALLKAAGVGLLVEPRAIELRGSEIVSVPPELGSANAWEVIDLAVPGCAAAVAVERPATTVRLHCLEEAGAAA